MKPFEELTISDDYMFYHVMQDEELCQILLTSILGDQIGEIKEIKVQKSFETPTQAKGIRLDIWIKDAEGKQYDIEMQTSPKRDLAKRMRYYQSAIDSHLLEKGSHYSELNDTFIIFICTFDYFKKGLPVYTFVSTCREDHKLELKDGAIKIIVNSTASEKATDPNLNAFLAYINGKHPDNQFVNRLEDRITKFKYNNKMQEEYMYRMSIEDEIRYEAHQEGIALGIEQGIERGITQGMEMGISKGMEMGVLKGRQEGILETKRKTDKSFKMLGISFEKIAQATGLSVDEIEQL